MKRICLGVGIRTIAIFISLVCPLHGSTIDVSESVDRLVFITERWGGYLRCGRHCPVCTMYSMEPDSSDIIFISIHETHEWQPSVDMREARSFTQLWIDSLNNKSENGTKTANVRLNYMPCQPGVNNGKADNTLFIGLLKGRPQNPHLLFKPVFH